MATFLTGLFLRGSAYYLRIVLPQHHPLRPRYRNGRFVCALGRCSYLEAVRIGTLKRAEVLFGFQHPQETPTLAESSEPLSAKSDQTVKNPVKLRNVFDRWAKAERRTADTLAACERALRLYEEHTGNPSLETLTRAEGDAFRAKLQELPTSAKTARDRLNWVKGLLKYAAQDLELIPKNTWEGLEIKVSKTTNRQPWSEAHLRKLLGHDIWQKGTLPKDSKAGGMAAYWIPLLALYTGARCSELCQLLVSDVDIASEIPTLRITNDAQGQRVKTTAGHRTIPIHSELIRLGFLDYVRSVEGTTLWPKLRQRAGKAGGYFSQYFGELRRQLDIPENVVFRSFRHSVRTSLSEAQIPEPTIDRILGHETQGSVGARIYTHVSMKSLKDGVEALKFPTLTLFGLNIYA